MKIDKNWQVVSDPLNIILQRRKVTKATEAKPKRAYWVNVAYYSSVGNALNGMVDFRIAETKLVDFKTVVAKQDELYKLIQSIKGGI